MSNTKYTISHRGNTPTVEVKLADGTTVIMNADEANEPALDEGPFEPFEPVEITADNAPIEVATPSVDGFEVSYNHNKITPGSTVTLSFGLVNPGGEVEFEFQPIVGSAFVQGVDGAFSIKRNGSKAKVQDVDRTFQVREDATADDDATITIVPHNEAARAISGQLTQDEATFHFAFVENDDELLDATKSDEPELPEADAKSKEPKHNAGKNKGKAGSK